MKSHKTGRIWRASKAAASAIRAALGKKPERTVFVSGVPRSGTNMLIGMLERGWHTRVYRESDPRAFDGFELRELETIRRLHDWAGARVFVIKALLDAHRVRDLMDSFAPAAATWSYRHYSDMINSNIRRWPGGRNRLEDVVRNPESAGYRGRGMSQETLKTLRDVYREKLSNEAAIALFWWYRHQLFFDQAFDRDERCVLVNYESMVSNPKALGEEICGRLEVSFSPAMIAHVHPRSVKKHDPPDLPDDIKAMCEEMLQRLDSVCRRQTAAAAASRPKAADSEAV